MLKEEIKRRRRDLDHVTQQVLDSALHSESYGCGM